MTKFKHLIAALVVPVLLVAGPAYAADEGQIEGGSFYFVKNLTQASAWGQTVTANAGDTLVYRVRVHNFGPSDVVNVQVKATMPSGAGLTSTATASSINANPGSVTSNTTSVTLSSAQTLTYVPGSTVLLDANAAQLSTLADSVLTTGVNIGLVKVCLAETRYVQFQVKVSQPTTPTPPVVTPQPQPLAKTGVAEDVAAVTALLAVLSIAYLRSRKGLTR